MKKYKAIATVIMALMVIPFLPSCLDDYDNNLDSMQEAMPYNAALATVVIPSEVPGEAVIESDDSGTAYVVNPEKLTQMEVNNTGQRIFYTYVGASSPKGDANSRGPYISINYLQKILTKDMDLLKEGEEAGAEDVYGQDGINLITPIMGKTHLTLMFQILASSSSIKHRISLVTPSGTVPDVNGYISVELRHNAEGDRQENLYSGYVSFPLSSVPGFEDGKLQGFRIKTRTINSGEETVTVSYNKSKSMSLPFTEEGLSNTKIK